MNKYICPKCRERSYSAASLENPINKNCEKCGAPITPAERDRTTPPATSPAPKIKLSALLSVLQPDTMIFIIELLGPYKYEAVFEGMARETLSNGILTECGENIILSVSPEINDTDPDDLTLPVLVVKISRGKADNNRKENVR